MTLHRNVDSFGYYGSYIDGDVILNTRSGKATLWDDDFANHWVARIQYDDF